MANDRCDFHNDREYYSQCDCGRYICYDCFHVSRTHKCMRCLTKEYNKDIAKNSIIVALSSVLSILWLILGFMLVGSFFDNLLPIVRIFVDFFDDGLFWIIILTGPVAMIGLCFGIAYEFTDYIPEIDTGTSIFIVIVGAFLGLLGVIGYPIALIVSAVNLSKDVKTFKILKDNFKAIK